MKRLLKNSAVVLLGLLAGLGLAEGALRVIGMPKFYRAHTLPAQPQFSMVGIDGRTLFYTNTPSADITFVYDGNPRGYFDADNAVHQHTNSLGFRGAEFVTAKDSNAYRLVFLGDSFTFGEGVKDEDVYPQQLARLLGAQFPARRFESYNFGVGGYNTSQSLYVLKKLALQFKPDAVVLGYTLNDAEPALFSADSSGNTVSRRAREASVFEGMSELPPPHSAVFRLRLVQLAWQVMGRRFATAQTITYYNQLYRDENPAWRETRSALQEFTRVCTASRIHCYVVIFPQLFRLGDDYPFSRPSILVQNELRSAVPEAVTILDLFPALKGRKDADLWVHPTDPHPNEIVHQLVADQLLAAMAARIGGPR